MSGDNMTGTDATAPPSRFGKVPVRYLLPNLITLLALCARHTRARHHSPVHPPGRAASLGRWASGSSHGGSFQIDLIRDVADSWAVSDGFQFVFQHPPQRFLHVSADRHGAFGDDAPDEADAEASS